MISESDQLKLFEENMAMAYHCLNKLFPNFANNKDYKQVALEGLWKACTKFDPEKGFRFSTFAYKVVENTIRKQLRSDNKAIQQGVILVSLDEPMDPSGRTFGDIVQVEDFSGESDFNIDLQTDLKKLDERQRAMLSAYVGGETQNKIGEYYQVSQSKVSRVISAARGVLDPQKNKSRRREPMEIQILNNGTQGIENYGTLMAWANNYVETYKGLVVMDDGISVAKKDVAELRKLAKLADEYRITITREHNRKIEKTVQQLKELAATFQEAAQGIDVQVKAYTDREKEIKKGQIQAYFDKNIGDLDGILDISHIWDDRWLNKGFNINNIQEAIDEAIKKVQNGILAIRNMGVKYEQEMINAFVSNMDMAVAIEKKTQLERQEEALKGKTEAEAVDSNEADTSVQSENEREEDKGLLTLTFTVTGTKEQMIALRNFMKENNIVFKKG